MQHNDPTQHALVSVIIPSFNRLQTLKRAIDSVLVQSYSNIELIVVDDGSSDGTSAWLAQLAPQKIAVRYIEQTNHGVSHARNRGIDIADGQWIALLDSDDYWHKDKLEKQMQSLALHAPCRVCHCDELWIRDGKRINQKHRHRKHGGDIFEQCLALCAMSPSAVVIHKGVFTQHGMFDETLPACEDYDLWLRITAHEPVAFVDEPLLTKTGGHDDQLSSHFPVMDRFRLQSLAGIIRSNTLNHAQRHMAHDMFIKKLNIVTLGAQKRNNEALLQSLERNYSDLVDKNVYQ